MPLFRRILKITLWTAALLAVAAGAAGLYAWRQLRATLPQLDGEVRLAGLGAPATIARDALGVPTIAGATREDVARATGFAHAQDRFFQMDLLRRRGAGELAEIFGPAALEIDQQARLHGFRRNAAEVIARATPAQRAVVRAYTEGVNAGLASLGRAPWEYLVLRTAPQPWREEDSILCIYAMWFDLQDANAGFERSRAALRDACGQPVLDFLCPRGDSWDAALDGSTFPAPPMPAIRFKRADSEKASGLPSAPVERQTFGSNAFAVAGAHTAGGAAILGSDMHLSLRVPNIWYRAVLQWTDAAGPHRVAGLTLPGLPFMVVGSNGHVAWGFTVAYVDTTDAVIAETSLGQYRTSRGWANLEERKDTIKVKGKPDVAFTSQWTEWGPIIGSSGNRELALAWTAHFPEATNLVMTEMETAASADAAVDIAHRSGLPNTNILIADSAGNIAWTIAGLVPRRVGFDGRLPVSWAYGDRRWDGWLKPAEIPVVANPADGVLWTSNNRALGGAGYELLGDGGYETGPRARQARDDLRALAASGRKALPADVLAIQLDDRALFLERWQKFLLEVLDDEAVAQKPARGRLRDAVRAWNGQASVDSAAYRIVKGFRQHTAERTFAPFVSLATDKFEQFSYRSFPYEDALWRLVHDQPVRLLNPENKTWESLLRGAADDVIADADKEGLAIEKFTWGRRNTLAMEHPFSRFLPGFLARHLNMPAEQLPGDRDMPRVQSRSFGQSERLVVSPGHEEQGILAVPGGQSGHPLSPYFQAGHDDWAKGRPTPLLPGPAVHTLNLRP